MSDERQNLYDNDEFFAGYSRSRKARSGLNEVLEQPAIRALLPDLKDGRVLDLGSGAGDFARWMVDRGASSVLGIEPSANMLGAANENPRNRIEYRQSFVEDLQLPEAQFGLVVSSLMFHYVEDLKPVIGNIRRWLRPGGMLVFSIEHPLTTAIQGKRRGWVEDDAGVKIGWLVDDYSTEGPRVSRWIVDGVVRYHRTLSTMLNMLIDSGFRIDRVAESHAPEEEEALDPELLEERMRPPFLFVRAIAD